MKLLKYIGVASLACSFSLPVMAQGTVEDYNRAYSLAKTYNYGQVPNGRISPRWIGDTDKFWYVSDQADGSKDYVVIDAKTGKKKPLLDREILAKAMTGAGIGGVNAGDLRLDQLRVSSSLDTLNFNRDGKMWMYVKGKKGGLECIGAIPERKPRPHWMVVDEEKNSGPVVSPDGKHSAFVRDNNLWVRNLATGAEKQLTMDGTLANYYSSYIYWSPDSRKVAINKIKPVEKRYVYYVESSPAQGSQPILHKQEYAKPGDELRFKLPVIADVETGEVIVPDTKLFDKQYDLYGPSWNQDGSGITFEYNERGHKNY
ncbi:MAG: DPP IV N-terminal domain-containing protein, partial [Muribaculaceae bacterium]|nr:DPP IV N-terminal domain-containing protein [Muribaculaceae bacterium]